MTTMACQNIGRKLLRLTEEQQRRYIAVKGTRCPYCGTKDVTVGDMQADGDTATQSVTCDECGENWTDVYTLTDIVEDE